MRFSAGYTPYVVIDFGAHTGFITLGSSMNQSCVPCAIYDRASLSIPLCTEIRIGHTRVDCAVWTRPLARRSNVKFIVLPHSPLTVDASSLILPTPSWPMCSEDWSTLRIRLLSK